MYLDFILFFVFALFVFVLSNQSEISSPSFSHFCWCILWQIRIGLACLLSTCVLHLGEELFKYKLAKKREEEEALQICDTNSLVPTEEGFDQTVDIAA